jgi:hypothetical protein
MMMIKQEIVVSMETNVGTKMEMDHTFGISISGKDKLWCRKLFDITDGPAIELTNE